MRNVHEIERVTLVAAALVLGAAAPAVALEGLRPAVPAAPGAPAVPPGPRADRHFVAIPPAYPYPPAGFLPLPSSARPLVLPDRPSPHHGHVWVPGRTEVVVGIDGRGRIIHVLEYIPGRFEAAPSPR